MTKIELVQKIGNEVCDGCGPYADCNIDPAYCSRIKYAIEALDKYAPNKALHSDAKAWVCVHCGTANKSHLFNCKTCCSQRR